MSDQLDLFGGGNVKGMVHADDPYTSTAAAEGILRCRTKLHEEIMEVLSSCNLTDEELEQLPQFSNYGPSTVRKRRSELFQAGRIRSKGEKTNKRGFKMVIWGI